MTVLSVALASRRLGVDPKTLRRWLSLAHLPVESHPGDGRLKGISSEHLELLAHLHHRSLAPLPSEPPAPVVDELPPLPAALLALPEQLSALQAQVAALRASVADLTRLLVQHARPSAHPAAPVQQAQKTRRPPSAPRSRPAASAKQEPARKPVHVIPRVEYGPDGCYVVICPKHGLLPFEPDTPAWFAWLAEQSSFRFVGKGGSFSAHHEWRIPRGAWRAHRHIRNQVYHLRLAPTQELTVAVLEQVAETLQAHLT